ncbi:MAG: class I SAM-dependent methyltransferase [Gemmatimonadaceae bacterium]|nr:class I SAM-dependent methyltransferase [Gemmatimonadaceae bacterium]
MTLENISDTARWVAMYRAWESERPDALFRDPYARRLAGPRGEEIVRALPGGRGMGWAMVVRTVAFDEIILRLVREDRVDVVLCLAAGLDTRPYRLPLPPTLHWIEVDLPALLEYKARELRDERPACRLTREAVDLSDEPARRALFARVGGMGQRVLVVAEGLLLYLRPEQVASLARDLRAQPSFRWLLIDFASPRILEFLRKRLGKHLDAAQATPHFAPAEGLAFFKPLGWEAGEVREALEWSERLKRWMPGWWLWRWFYRLTPAKRREQMRKEYMSGTALLYASDASS